MNMSLLLDALAELAPLACFTIFVFYAFCDGFNLRPARKIVWALYFLWFCYFSYYVYGRYDLYVIIPLSSLMAFVMAWFQKRENRLKDKK